MRPNRLKNGWTKIFTDKCAAIGRASHPVSARIDAGPDSIFNSKLVHISHGKGPARGEFSWHQWATALGWAGNVPIVGPTVTAEHLAVDLVLAEDPLALVSLFNASFLLTEGRLRAAPGSEVASRCSYWIKVTNRHGRDGRTAHDFLAWMQQELADEQQST